MSSNELAVIQMNSKDVAVSTVGIESGESKERIKIAVMALAILGFAFLFVITQPAYADTIFEVAEKTATTLIGSIKNLYFKAIFPIAFVIDLIALALTKDEKKLAVEKRALIILVAVFIGMYLVSALAETLAQIGSELDGSSLYGN